VGFIPAQSHTAAPRRWLTKWRVPMTGHEMMPAERFSPGPPLACWSHLPMPDDWAGGRCQATGGAVIRRTRTGVSQTRTAQCFAACGKLRRARGCHATQRAKHLDRDPPRPRPGRISLQGCDLRHGWSGSVSGRFQHIQNRRPMPPPRRAASRSHHDLDPVSPMDHGVPPPGPGQSRHDVEGRADASAQPDFHRSPAALLS